MTFVPVSPASQEAQPAESVVAGFEPFAGRHRNRSWLAIERLPELAGVRRVRLPVDFVALPDRVAEILEVRPRVLLLVGESDRRQVSVEQVALNVVDSERPDNAGRVARAEAVEEGGLLALPAAWDAHQVVAELRAAGIAAKVSFHAGTYACNLALYRALYQGLASDDGQETRVGFLHVPRYPWPVGPRLSVLARAIEVALSALVGRRPPG